MSTVFILAATAAGNPPQILNIAENRGYSSCWMFMNLVECICLHCKVLLVTVFVCCFARIQSWAQNLSAFKFWQLCTNASWARKCFAVVQSPNPVSLMS